MELNYRKHSMLRLLRCYVLSYSTLMFDCC
jgi:hypothetical protein